MRFSLVDSHCHLDLEPLASEIVPLVQEAASVGITRFIVPGVHPDGWPGITALAVKNSAVMPAYGIHPMHADGVNDQALDRLLKCAGTAVAIGEIGLDPGYQVPMAVQEQAFREQLRVAVTCGAPVLVHCRRAFQRVLTILVEEHAERVGGIMHAFSGSVEMAQKFIRLGFAISISGTVTWHNAVKPVQIAQELPLKHLVLETDAPDMTPQRYRGAFNRPAWMIETVLRLAELRGISAEDVARITTANVCRVLRLESTPAAVFNKIL